MNAGVYDEAAAWRDWLHARRRRPPARDADHVRPRGERRLDRMGGRPGCRATRTRSRCASATPRTSQFQLDVYGEVMDALEQARKGGLAATEDGWELQRALLEHVAEVWHEPDSGIWEMRGRRAALHLFQGHGLGRLRSRHQGRRGTWPCTARSSNGARCATRIHAEVCDARLRRRAQQLPCGLRQRRARRQPAAAARRSAS